MGSPRSVPRYISTSCCNLHAVIHTTSSDAGIPGVRNVILYQCCPDNPYIDLTFTIQLRRRKLYYIVNIVTPCLMLAALTLVTFTIPPDAGEKISFGRSYSWSCAPLPSLPHHNSTAEWLVVGVTILLSLTVFLLMVAEALPASSDAVPLIGRGRSTYLPIIKSCHRLSHCGYVSSSLLQRCHVTECGVSGVHSCRTQLPSPHV